MQFAVAWAASSLRPGGSLGFAEDVPMYLSIPMSATTAPKSPRPTTFWRSRTADEFSASDIAVLADGLRRVAIADERWPLARQGRAAEAIAMMVAEWPIASVSPRIDAIMTAVTMAALAGSAAAALVVYHTISQLASHLPEFCPLVASWLGVVKEQEARRFSRRTAPRNQPLSEVVASPNPAPGGM
jgi:hypothetical protein